MRYLISLCSSLKRWAGMPKEGDLQRCCRVSNQHVISLSDSNGRPTPLMPHIHTIISMTTLLEQNKAQPIECGFLPTKDSTRHFYDLTCGDLNIKGKISSKLIFKFKLLCQKSALNQTEKCFLLRIRNFDIIH